MLKTLMYIIVAIAFLDMFAQFPIMSPYALSLGASSVMIGIVIGSYSLTNLFGNILAGKWIDRYGAKKILVIGMLFTGCFVGLYTLVSTPEQLVVIRLVHGLVSGFLAPSVFTWLSQNANSDGLNQGKNMALSGASVGVAAVLGPAISGALKSIFGVHSVFIFMSALMLLCGLIISFFIKYEPLTQVSKQQLSDETNSEWLQLFRNHRAVQSFIGAFSLMSAMGVLTYMLPLKVQELGLDEKAAGLMLSTFGVVAVLFFILPTNRLFDRINLNSIMLSGIFLLAAAVLMLSLFSSEVVIYAALGVYGLGFALIFPSITKNLVESVPEKNKGKAFGVFYAIYSIGVVFGSFVIGILDLSTDAGFRLTALFLMIMGPLIYVLGSKKK